MQVKDLKHLLELLHSQTLTQEELFDSRQTNIGAALNCGAFYAYD